MKYLIAILFLAVFCLFAQYEVRAASGSRTPAFLVNSSAKPRPCTKGTLQFHPNQKKFFFCVSTAGTTRSKWVYGRMSTATY